MHLPSWPKAALLPKKIPHYRELENTVAILEELGNPHCKLPPTIHIAGSNGKGSSVAMLRAIYMQAGFKVDTYTSPHLREFNERIGLDGKNISDAYLNFLLQEVKIVCDKLSIKPGFFQATTIAAFLAFSKNNADILILETGLGGLHDTTNIIPNPIATIITPISYDHMEYLGSTIESITLNKAGIIKPNSNCIVSAQTNESYNILFNRCAELKIPAAFYEYDFGIEKTDSGFKYLSKNHTLNLPMPNLCGHHQLVNAATVIATILMINDKYGITDQHIRAGLTNIKWPGRIEKINLSRIAGKKNDITIYLDGAHNIAGAQSLELWIKNNLTDPNFLIIGMTRNRDIEAFCNEFKDIIQETRCVTVLSEPSSYDATTIAKRLNAIGIKSIASKSLEEAIASIINNYPDKKLNIIVTGSLFLISDFKKYIMY